MFPLLHSNVATESWIKLTASFYFFVYMFLFFSCKKTHRVDVQCTTCFIKLPACMFSCFVITKCLMKPAEAATCGFWLQVPEVNTLTMCLVYVSYSSWESASGEAQHRVCAHLLPGWFLLEQHGLWLAHAGGLHTVFGNVVALNAIHYDTHTHTVFFCPSIRMTHLFRMTCKKRFIHF